MKKKGRLFILSAPSGAGKSTLCNALLEKFPDMRYSVSSTTRPPRKGEVPGVDYHFVSQADFEAGIRDGKWAEWAQVHGNYYGTDAGLIDAGLAAGDDILLDIDVQGTGKILDRYSDGVTIFILPPSMEELERRLKNRGTDDPETITIRLANAEQEMEKSVLYRHVITNDELSAAKNELFALVEKS